MNSEHEYEVSGTRQEGSDLSKHELREATGGEPDLEEGSKPHRTRATSMTEMDEAATNEGENLAARTPHEMDLHDELSRTPTKKHGGEHQRDT